MHGHALLWCGHCVPAAPCARLGQAAVTLAALAVRARAVRAMAARPRLWQGWAAFALATSAMLTRGKSNGSTAALVRTLNTVAAHCLLRWAALPLSLLALAVLARGKATAALVRTFDAVTVHYLML
jgi:hypothetical protein